MEISNSGHISKALALGASAVIVVQYWLERMSLRVNTFIGME